METTVFAYVISGFIAMAIGALIITFIDSDWRAVGLIPIAFSFLFWINAFMRAGDIQQAAVERAQAEFNVAHPKPADQCRSQ